MKNKPPCRLWRERRKALPAMMFIVQTVTTDAKANATWSLSTFSTLEMAKAWARSHPRSLVFRRDQVARIINNKLALRADDHMPVKI